MENQDLVARELMSIHFRWHRLIQAIQQQEGLDQETVVNGRILGYLVRNKDSNIYQKDIEREACLTKSAVSNIVSGMERKGYVRRQAVLDDARLKRIVLTEEGEATYNKLLGTYKTVELNFVKGLTVRDQETLISLLTHINKNMREMEAETKA